MPVDEFGELLGIALPPHHRYNTVAGLVLQEFNVLPNIGDAFDIGDWHIEVLDLDGRRIDKILATRRGEEETG